MKRRRKHDDEANHLYGVEGEGEEGEREVYGYKLVTAINFIIKDIYNIAKLKAESLIINILKNEYYSEISNRKSDNNIHKEGPI